MKKHFFPLTTTNIILIISFAVFLFGSGYKYAQWKFTSDTHNVFSSIFYNTSNKKQDSVDFQLFWDTWNKLEQKFISKEKLDPETMFYGAIKGMVASLDDPYTFFLTPKENQQTKDDLGGKFQGIGAQLGLKDNRVVVIAPLSNSPAEQAGVRAGDFINKVDGKSTKDLTLFETVAKIRGPENTKVVLTLERKAKEFDVSIERKEILIPSVELSYVATGSARLADIKINQFGDTTNAEWNSAVDEVASAYANGTVDGIILDVRDNPGGYLESSVYVASDLLKKGQEVVRQESSDGSSKSYKVQRDGKLLTIPMVTLINQGSASAAEILAGALRDHGRTKLVGEKSFGKGSVQEALDLKGGAGLHVTIAKWILPNGDWINGTGIEPSMKVENMIDEENTVTEETDKQKKKAIEVLLQVIK